MGIDHIFFDVTDLEQAINFYQKIGFTLKCRIPAIPAALLRVGNEEPGILLCQSKATKTSYVWFEVFNAYDAQKECLALGIDGYICETETGCTFEMVDPWGNKLGFADYSKKLELAREI